ncbi:transcription factor IIIB 50 kDa subunit [Tetranychus urticae]|uniref:BRF2-like C-terminal domain-containing protein n=1 Tax=Tetranychus urticae TaxID=32264 RepID=T1K9H7_TETUR|nr:transcription factor IIIB 50 kDa subunit [Tetranychus urticae]
MDNIQCSNCSSKSIDVEHGSWICLNCGLIVADKSQFQSNAEHEGLTYTNNSFFDGHRGLPNSVKHSLHRKAIAPACKNALERTKRLGEYFKFSPTMMQNLLDIFQTLLKSSIFIKKYTKNKAILGGVVAFIVTNQAGMILPMDTICGRVGCSLPEFKSILNMVLEANPSLKPTPKPINDLIPHTLNEAKFDESESKVINERTDGLVKLVKDANLMDGKHPTYVIQAALCLAWKSIKPKERGPNKITFKKFCNICKLPYSETGNQRFKELLDFTCTLITYLPWTKVSKQDSKSDIAFHLMDILNHSTLLIHRHREANKPKIPVVIQETSNLMKNYKPVIYSEEPEISDKEIESYIRSKKEIEFIKDLQSNLQSSSPKD